jgi:hypothetical protein
VFMALPKDAGAALVAGPAPSEKILSRSRPK